MAGTWLDAQIDVKGRTAGDVRTTCPRCSHLRKKRLYPCLHADLDQGLWHCHHCGWSGSLKQGEFQRAAIHRTYRKPDYVKQSSPLTSAALEFFTKRGITEAVLMRNMVSSGKTYFPQTESEHQSMLFPYRRRGEAVNIKHRSFDKLFRLEGGCERILFGLDDIGDQLVWVEGEVDKLSLETAGILSCVSVPDGAPPPHSKNYESKFDFLDAVELARASTHLIAVDRDPPGLRLRDELVRRLGPEKCRIVDWPDGCNDANDVLVQFGVDTLLDCIKNARELPIVGAHTVSDYMDDIHRIYREGIPRGVSTGWVNVDKHYKVRPGDVTVITGSPNSGKALALDTPVPIPSGWTTMGALRVGDQVFDESGRVCCVSHAFDVLYDRACSCITFTDGTTVIADDEHQWVTRTEKARASALTAKKKRGGRERTLPHGTDQRWKQTHPAPTTTKEIAETLFATDGRANHAVSLCGAIEPQQNVALAIAPYTLGVWLGDGSSHYAGLSCADNGIIEQLTADGTAPKKWASGALSYGLPGLLPRLRMLGVLNNKHIPPAYLRASAAERLALLQGLMDTDGHCQKNGMCEFTTTKQTLAYGTCELIRSLGMSANVCEGRATLYGKDCGAKYRIGFAPNAEVFRLQRKLERRQRPARVAHRKIVSVLLVDSVPVRCIAVDAPSHQYLVTRAFIPTHNSEWLDALAMNIALSQDWRFAVFSPEQGSIAEHVAKLVEKRSGLPFNDGPTERIDPAALDKTLTWINDKFLFIQPDTPTLEEILKIGAALVLRKGVRGVIIDPWNEIEHARPRDVSETEYIGDSLRRIRIFSKSHQVHVWLVAHPHKLLKDPKTGQYPVAGPYEISGSAHFHNKPDVCISVWRSRGETFTPEVQIHIQKVRSKYVGRLGLALLEWNRMNGRYSDVVKDKDSRRGD